MIIATNENRSLNAQLGYLSFVSYHVRNVHKPNVPLLPTSALCLSLANNLILLNLEFSTLFLGSERIRWIDVLCVCDAMCCVVLLQIMWYRDAKSSGIFNSMTPGRHLCVLLTNYYDFALGILQYGMQKQWKSIKISKRLRSFQQGVVWYSVFHFNKMGEEKKNENRNKHQVSYAYSTGKIWYAKKNEYQSLSLCVKQD